jgi:CheY-like chemotaxis protein
VLLMARLLLVNDERLFLELEQSFVRREECQVITASSAEEALERARSERPDLVLLDVAIPRMDGQQVCRSLKTDPELSSTPVLLLTTGRSERGALEAGADGTIQKPITRQKVLRAMERFLDIPQRAAERRAVRIPVQCREPSHEYRAQTRDLSFTGMFLACSPPPPVGRHLDLSFRIPPQGRGPSIQAEAEVVRSVDPSPDSHRLPGVGVRFLGLDAGLKARIGRFVREPWQRARSGELG